MPLSIRTNKLISTSGFDFNEALHPTMELDEIMKVFNIGKKDDDKQGK